MARVYLLGLAYVNSTTSHLSTDQEHLVGVLQELKGASNLEVRAGYFGLCVRTSGSGWICGSDPSSLAHRMGAGSDPLDLIGAAARFKDDVVFSGLLFMAVVLSVVSFCFLATFPGWHKEINETGSEIEVKPFPSKPVSYLVLACNFSASTLLLVSGLWQHVGAVGAAAMVESAYLGNVKSTIGSGAVAMVWLSMGLTLTTMVGIGVLIISTIILDRMAWD